VDVPDPVMLVGASVHVMPVAGLMLDARLTAPLKLWSPVTVTVEVPEVPAFTVTVIGLDAIVKSWTVYVTVAE
jgi:hypothetical protein